MKKHHLIISALLLGGLLMACDNKEPDTGWPEVTTEAKPWTRWWWMGSAVDKQNLTYNLEEMSKASIGGVEITPIYGVKGQEDNYIQYLSSKWMEMLAHTEAEAARLNMLVDMNMGTGWPFGGPEITLEDAATKAIFQNYELKGGTQLSEKIEVKDKKQKDVAVLQKLMAYLPDSEVLDITDKVNAEGYLTWTAPEGKDCKLVALFMGKTFQKVKRPAPGGEGYVLNHFDAEAVKRYFSKFDKAFSASKAKFPHSFFNDSYEVYGADWTADFLEQFEKRRGYKLENHFTDLLANGETEFSARIISDYRETIGNLLHDNFSASWANWAHERKVTIRNQAHGSPANLLDIYAAVDIPECESFGITDFDIPYLRKDSIRKENDGDPVTLKYASSAANIAGKKYTSSETFTWLTEHFRTSLSQTKPEIDQMFTSGVNHVYFHGATYSPKEAAWPGWKFYASVDMTPTNSIWRDAPAFFQYITRVQSFLQYGSSDNDFLLYFPVYDIWNEQRGDIFYTFAIHGMRKRLPDFYKAVESVREQGYDLDYISDSFIESATVENGLIKMIGGATYKALIFPSSKLMPLETLTKVQALAEQGATVIFVDQYPSDVPGFSNLEQRRGAFKDIMAKMPSVDSFSSVSVNVLGKGRVITGTDYAKILTKCDVDKETLASELGCQYIRRKNETGYHYFIALLQNKPVDTWVTLAVEAKSAMLFDPMTGKSGLAKVRENDGKLQVYMQLQAGASVILKTFDKLVEAPEWNYYQDAENKDVELNTNWEMSFVESWPAVEESFKIDSLKSWTEVPNELLSKNMGTARYKKEIDITKTDGLEYRLCLGDVRESARVFINGKEVAVLFAVPFETNIGEYLQNGKNVIEIEVTNLPANRIADYDRTGVEWRIFQDINIVSVNYKPGNFDTWGIIPSGLLGPVSIKELKKMNL
ncbi:glycosyl hydrolase family 2 [Dysgonomonas sp. 216]|uniref:alpha-L-rhamnosidase n=1 Tax=Dysgonomonas sp. 216 TaxID=2302934 RepID=UPI0013D31087|nr:glycosyl hydrolase [Dysgonomonas sp. 216]NDW19108.1 glycosyl hydrolase family 2 [Dysgonomonas sp. 216]